jgi:hypothetical protein
VLVRNEDEGDELAEVVLEPLGVTYDEGACARSSKRTSRHGSGTRLAEVWVGLVSAEEAT